MRHRSRSAAVLASLALLAPCRGEHQGPGRLPVFDGTNTWKVCLQHLHEKPLPPSQRVDFEIPSDLEALVMNCLRKHPQNRPANAVEFERQLASCRDADRWNQQRADEWFRAHAKELEALKSAELGQAQPRQLAIDLGDRLGSAAGDRTLPSQPRERDPS